MPYMSNSYNKDTDQFVLPHGLICTFVLCCIEKLIVILLSFPVMHNQRCLLSHLLMFFVANIAINMNPDQTAP